MDEGEGCIGRRAQRPRPTCQGLQAFGGEGEGGAAFVFGEGVEFVDEQESDGG